MKATAEKINNSTVAEINKLKAALQQSELQPGADIKIIYSHRSSGSVTEINLIDLAHVVEALQAAADEIIENE